LSDLGDNPNPHSDFDGNGIANSIDLAERLPPSLGPIGHVTEDDKSLKKKKEKKKRRGRRRGGRRGHGKGRGPSKP
jgi:hypothetical protein